MTEIHKAALFLQVKIYHSCPMNMQKNKESRRSKPELYKQA